MRHRGVLGRQGGLQRLAGAHCGWLVCLAVKARKSAKARGITALCAHRRMGEVKCVYSGAARP